MVPLELFLHIAEGIEDLLQDPEPRIRHAAILAAHQADDRGWNPALIELCAREQDRVVFYSAWQALRSMMPQITTRSPSATAVAAMFAPVLWSAVILSLILWVLLSAVGIIGLLVLLPRLLRATGQIEEAAGDVVVALATDLNLVF